jgi:hypothetical protein
MSAKPKLVIAILAVFAMSFIAGPTVTEYLSVPGPIVLNKNSFNLAWSSHPSANYYKQEYIPAKEHIEKFNKMVMVELLISDATPAGLAKAKTDELKQLKQTNPMINYETFQKNGEVLLDFLITANSPDGKKIDIIERNVYRYKSFSGNGKKGVILFGASERAYGNNVDAFLVSLKKNKSLLLNAVAGFSVPQVSIK